MYMSVERPSLSGTPLSAEPVGLVLRVMSNALLDCMNAPGSLWDAADIFPDSVELKASLLWIAALELPLSSELSDLYTWRRERWEPAAGE